MRSGMTDTLMDHPPAFPEESLYGGGDNRITARDVNKGLKALWDGRVLNPFWRDYMLQKMTLVKPGLNYLIAAGAGAGATVSHKNGFLYEEGWADNDIGIVWYERGGERVRLRHLVLHRERARQVRRHPARADRCVDGVPVVRRRDTATREPGAA